MIVVGACAAVVLAGTAGAVAWAQAGSGAGRPVGTWHDAPGVARTPVSGSEQDRAPGAPGAPGSAAGGAVAPGGKAQAAPQKPAAEAQQRRIIEESAQAAAAKGRQKVGELLPVDKLLGTLNGPRRETFRYPGASYVKLHFSRMMMLPGDYLTVSDPSGQESYRYDASGLLDAEKSDKWAMSITGDTAVLEMHRATNPLGVTSLLGNLGVRVDQVARGFSRSEQKGVPAESLHAPGRTGREESVCGGDQSTDAVCYRSADPVAYTRSKSIARLLIDGTELCTGWRVGTQNRMLTNNHCFDNSGDAYDTEVWFNYQCARCGGFDVFKPTKVWGDKVLTTNQTYDYTLFTVENFGQVQKFGYLTLDTARPAKDQPLYVPQHPAGEPTRIAGAKGERAGNCAVVDNAYDGYANDSDVSYFCDTEGGSSGSPVLSRKTNKVVALHHFGGCPNSGVRADLLYGKLKSFL
jgi:V8-like Glu-specific endopeptidase